MAAIDSERLNSLFVLLHRSLLQYVGECWPWTADDEHQAETQGRIKALVDTQKSDEVLLADAVTESGWVLNRGTYPTQFTDLQYLSLKYLLKQIVVSQTEIVTAFEGASAAEPDCPVLSAILTHEREILTKVQSLSASPTMVTA